MSDVLTINTDVAAGLKKPEQKVEPLSVFDERHPMMAEIMPEFIGVLPNTSMTHLVKRLKWIRFVCQSMCCKRACVCYWYGSISNGMY